MLTRPIKRRAFGTTILTLATATALACLAPLAHDAKAEAPTATANEGKETMITAVVRFQLPAGTTSAQAKALFESTVPTYQKVPGLIRKYYLYGEGPVGGGVYLWKDRASADGLYTAEWRKAIQDRLGAAPEITFFETPIVIDNKTNEVLSE